MKNVTEWNDFALSRVGRSFYRYSSLEELKEALSYYGLPKWLADFDEKKLDKANGYIKNDYQSWSALAYPPTE